MMGALVLSTTSSFAAEDPAPEKALAVAGLTLVKNPLKRKLSEDEAARLFAEHAPVGLIAGLEPLTEKVLSGAPSLKVVSRCGTGLENVDVDAAKRLGIAVYNTPDAPAQAVAELAVGLMLAALRKIAASDRAIRAGAWKREMGSLLGTKTVGVVGFGRIGRKVAALVSAFGARVIASDEIPFEAPGVERVSFEGLLSLADIVSLHAPLTESSRNLIRAETIAQMKHKAVLVNTARGGLIDESALAAALASGKLGAAALDVFSEEPYSGPLTKVENAVLTAHMGSAAEECRVKMELEAAVNLVSGLKAAGAL